MTKRRKSFTLVELLIAVGLLSLIMMLLLQLFSGAQKIWTASEKTNNVYTDARVAMELMADLLNTVQFSHGENDAGERDKTKDMIFSLDTEGGTDKDSCCIVFAAKPARDLPMKNSTTRFISFRRGSGDESGTKGKLFMVIYSDKNNEKTFLSYFPAYKTLGNRTAARNSLETQLKNLVNNYSSSDDGENEFCQVIAENVVAFKLTAYTLDNSGELKKKDDAADIAEPPYMIEMQLTLLDPDSYARWDELSGDAKKDYLDQHKRTFTRNVFIGNRWALEAQEPSGSGGGH